MRFYPFVFTGKERNAETGYGYFAHQARGAHHGARDMDHEFTTMWLSVDPMSDKCPSVSPYAYCAWNPMKLVDPDGREAMDEYDGWKVEKQNRTITRVSLDGGDNENTNGLYRQYFPKVSDFNRYTNYDVCFTNLLINNRPRKRLNFSSPIQEINRIFAPEFILELTQANRAFAI